MANSFKRAQAVAGTTRVVVYGPVPALTTAIVFAGTLANIDDTNKQRHTITIEVGMAGPVYVRELNVIPVDYGASSKFPKTVLNPGEYIYATSDVANVIQCVVQVLEKT